MDGAGNLAGNHRVRELSVFKFKPTAATALPVQKEFIGDGPFPEAILLRWRELEKDQKRLLEKMEYGVF